MRVIDQDTGKPFNLDTTPELHSDLDAFYASECQHPDVEIRKRTISSAQHFYRQCKSCGSSIGSALKRSPDLEGVPLWDAVRGGEYNDARQKDRGAILQKHVRKQKNGDDGFRREYDLYLESPTWAAKRSAVLKRANFICEGCLINKATQVHHLTYRHVFKELMFELVAVCADCHARVHADNETNDAADDDSERSEWEDGHPCEGCRFGSEEKGRRWCFILEKLAADALAEGGGCGPQLDNFEPLR
jgi:hypothetical protein